jgi:hypothetical protein
MARTASAEYFTGLRDTLTGLGADFLRARFIDLERADDDRNLPDRIDAADGQTVNKGGVSWGLVLGVGAALIVGVIVAKKVL